MLGQEPGGEGDERDHHQEQHVQQQKQPVDVRDLAHDGVVVGPDDSDRDEAHGVRHVARPDLQQLQSQRRAFC